MSTVTTKRGPSRKSNPHGTARIMVALWASREALSELATHDDDCTCEMCHEREGHLWAVQTVESLLSSGILGGLRLEHLWESQGWAEFSAMVDRLIASAGADDYQEDGPYSDDESEEQPAAAPAPTLSEPGLLRADEPIKFREWL